MCTRTSGGFSVDNGDANKNEIRMYHLKDVGETLVELLESILVFFPEDSFRHT